MSPEPSFWEVTDSCFCSICKFGSLKNTFTTITSQSGLYFRFRRFILLLQTKKNDFYELWKQQKLAKTMDMSKVWSDTYDEGYTHQFMPELPHNIC